MPIEQSESTAAPKVQLPGIVDTDGDAKIDGAMNRGGIGGVHLGTMCHAHIMTEVYADFDSEGHLVALHSHDIGSC